MSDVVILVWNKKDYSDIRVVCEHDDTKPAIFDAEGDADEWASGHYLNYRIVSLSGEDAI